MMGTTEFVLHLYLYYDSCLTAYGERKSCRWSLAKFAKTCNAFSLRLVANNTAFVYHASYSSQL